MTYVNDNAFAKIVIVWDGLEVRNSSELGVGGVPVLVLAAELGQRPKTKTHFQSLRISCLQSCLVPTNVRWPKIR